MKRRIAHVLTGTALLLGIAAGTLIGGAPLPQFAGQSIEVDRMLTRGQPMDEPQFDRMLARGQPMDEPQFD